MEQDIQSRFERATKYVEHHHQSFTKNQLIDLYGYYKQVTCGKCNIPRPGMFEFEKSKKWNAWMTLGALSKEAAMEYYIDYVDKIKPNWTLESVPVSFSGVFVSSLSNTQEDDLSECDKTIFDWVKENNINKVKELRGKFDVNHTRDEDGMTLLHWASDRGFVDIVSYLLVDLQADANVTDNEGQTPMHFAACCAHIPVIENLLLAGARLDIPDNNNLLPYHIADGDIRESLRIQ